MSQAKQSGAILRKQCREELDNTVPILDELRQYERMKKVEGVQILVTARAELARDGIMDTYSKLTRQLEFCKEFLLNEVDKKAKEKRATLSTYQTNLRCSIADIDDKMAQLNDLLNAPEDGLCRHGEKVATELKNAIKRRPGRLSDETKEFRFIENPQLGHVIAPKHFGVLKTFSFNQEQVEIAQMTEHASVGKSTGFRLKISDCHLGDAGHYLVVKAKSLDTNERLLAHVQDLQNGSYDCCVTPTATGIHQIKVYLFGVLLKGCPVQFKVSAGTIVAGKREKQPHRVAQQLQVQREISQSKLCLHQFSGKSTSEMDSHVSVITNDKNVSGTGDCASKFDHHNIPVRAPTVSSNTPSTVRCDGGAASETVVSIVPGNSRLSMSNKSSEEQGIIATEKVVKVERKNSHKPVQSVKSSPFFDAQMCRSPKQDAKHVKKGFAELKELKKTFEMGDGDTMNKLASSKTESDTAQQSLKENHEMLRALENPMFRALEKPSILDTKEVQLSAVRETELKLVNSSTKTKSKTVCSPAQIDEKKLNTTLETNETLARTTLNLEGKKCTASKIEMHDSNETRLRTAENKITVLSSTGQTQESLMNSATVGKEKEVKDALKVEVKAVASIAETKEKPFSTVSEGNLQDTGDAMRNDKSQGSNVKENTVWQFQINSEASVLENHFRYIRNTQRRGFLCDQPIRGRFIRSIPGSSDEQLQFPIGIDVDQRTGTIWICDTGNNMVKKFSWEGKLIDTIGQTGGIAFQRPSAVRHSFEGKLFVKDDYEVQVLDSDLKLDYKFGKRVLEKPYGLCWTPSGNLLILDEGRACTRMVIFSETGKLLQVTPFMPAVHRLKGSKVRFLALSNRRLVVSDLGLSTVYVTDHFGRQLTYIGGPGFKLGLFRDPAGVAADGEGNVIVADSKNDRLQVYSSSFDYGGLIELDRKIKRPSDIFLTRDNHLLIVSLLNHCVQVFKLFKD